MMAMHKGPVIFVHIPKCGGTTFVDILSRNHSPYFYVPPNTDVAEFLKKWDRLPSSAAISGHFPYQRQEVFGDNPFFCTIVRDPLQNLMSLYHYVMEKPEHWLHDQVRGMSPINFFRKLVEINHPAINSRQCTMIAGENAHDIVDTAKRNIDNNFDVVAPLDNFESLVDICKTNLGWKDYNYKILNSSANNGYCDKEAENFLEEYISDDVAIYNHAKEVFQKKFLTSL
jgi:hypothetical protein